MRRTQGAKMKSTGETRTIRTQFTNTDFEKFTCPPGRNLGPQITLYVTAQSF